MSRFVYVDNKKQDFPRQRHVRANVDNTKQEYASQRHVRVCVHSTKPQ